MTTKDIDTRKSNGPEKKRRRPYTTNVTGKGNRSGGNNKDAGSHRTSAGGAGRDRNRRMRPPAHPPMPETKRSNTPAVAIPPMPENSVRVIPLGGVEEVGKNMFVFETNQDIIIVDAGFQFVGEEEAPGVDYVLPNTRYLEERKHKIRGLVVTHGHLDHIGGIPYLIERIGLPPIYTRELTSIMIKKRQSEFPAIPELTYNVVTPGQRISFNDMAIRFFPVTHSIPDSMGVILETVHGNVLITGDLKLEHKDGIPTKKEEDLWGSIGKEDNLLFMADSTNAEQPGFSIPESIVHHNLENLIKDAQSRLIIGTFASQFERMIKIIEICEKYNKKVVTEGRSIRTNIEVAQKANLLTVKPDTIITAGEIADFPPDRIVVLATGAQGEEFAALMRIATKQHKFITLNERDTVILSSSVIPGNEISVQKLKDNLYRNGCKLIHYRTSEVHSGGHARQGELAWINKQVAPRFFMPAFGWHSMIRVHAEIAVGAGMKKENIIIADNGMITQFTAPDQMEILKERAPAEVVMVDGFSVGDVQEVVIRDRQALAQDGIFVVIVVVDSRTGAVRKSPDIISRGFVYLRESQDLLRQARFITKKTIETQASGMHPVNFEFIKKRLTDELGKFLLQQTAKRPIVLPVLLGV